LTALGDANVTTAAPRAAASASGDHSAGSVVYVFNRLTL
jgi:hypothetical protein